MSHRNLKYLNDNRIIYRRYSSDIPTKQYSWGWHYADIIGLVLFAFVPGAIFIGGFLEDGI